MHYYLLFCRPYKIFNNAQMSCQDDNDSRLPGMWISKSLTRIVTWTLFRGNPLQSVPPSCNTNYNFVVGNQ